MTLIIDILFDKKQMSVTVKELCGINTERADLYKLCEEYNVGITVMKGFCKW